ncbi:hypothetical protein CONCODRAFT_8261 [Conidiobolus coronatus NRRL 28638]|uniref:Uncharacterized protein n=1 Tax=Conidiobolus coronatus (strain ATCC 28846 / CBS 209.66 / NRRL 28638) TaxID=796925 RepID=A0A137P2U3_CONC2|nr:hypothetical protein CONCODRAFT_8261 [Conidiobolus coronatus NRRL 28638]|eukprot:KXN69346.1 hypothetical protein CONCODRAFT_8261 [Conidiobolus coronatus NRRL 28638]
MVDFIELLFLGSLVFTSAILFEFILLEYVLRLNAFRFGKIWLRLILIGALESQSLFMYLTYKTEDAYRQLVFILIGSWSYVTWSPLFYHMLIEQNAYLLSYKAKRCLYLLLIFYAFVVLVVVGSYTLYATKLGPPILNDVCNNTDILQLIIMSLTESYVLYAIFKGTKSKSVSSVSY